MSRNVSCGADLLGAKEIRDRVLEAALCAAATTLVHWGMERLKRAWQERPASLRPEGETLE